MPSKPAWLCCGVATLAVAFIAMQAAASPDRQNFSLVEKGRYLAITADCAACHDAADGRPYAGGRPIETPFGNIVASNITPEQETGIGSWTDDDFDNAVRKGVRPDGARLYPAMPYNAYTKMSRDDVLAIRAYLATVDPVRKRIDANTLPFPFNIRAAMRAWNALYFTAGEFKPDLSKSAEWNRGAFLVEGPGHCAACHTPKTFLGGDKTGEHLRGSYLQGWFAPDITNDDRAGLGRWSPDDVVAYLKTGHNRIAAATGPMAEEIAQSTSHMHDADLKAIATYLKSLPGRGGTAAPLPASDPMMVAGQAIYRDQCSACHGLDGKGVPQLFPSLAESPSIRASDPTSLVRVILRGARSVATAAEPTAPGMPSFAWQLDDAQIAAVTTYIRNAWPPSAGAVAAQDVKRLRSDLSARTD